MREFYRTYHEPFYYYYRANQMIYLQRGGRNPIFICIFYSVVYYLREIIKKEECLKGLYSKSNKIFIIQIASNNFTPYFFTFKQVTNFLNISASIYRGRESKSLAPKGKQILGSTKLYRKAKIILFAEGKWKSLG